MLDALTLDQMRVFVAVSETGSFRAGAGRLSRVQSAVSHAIGTLETELGVALFDRSGHKPLLTAEGRALLADARAILLKVDAMRARARGLGEGIELGLSIVVDNLFPVAAVGAAGSTGAAGSVNTGLVNAKGAGFFGAAGMAAVGISQGLSRVCGGSGAGGVSGAAGALSVADVSGATGSSAAAGVSGARSPASRSGAASATSAAPRPPTLSR